MSPQERILEHIVEQTVAFFVRQIKVKTAVVRQVLHQERIHKDTLEPNFPRRTCRRRKRQSGEPGCVSEEVLLGLTRPGAETSEAGCTRNKVLGDFDLVF